MSVAEDLARYIEGLEITQGDGEGRPFPLLPWQRRFLRGAFSPRYREAPVGLSVARGNGKSSFIAAIACAALDGPLVRRRADWTIVASSFEQGRIVFEHVLAMLRAKGYDLEPKRGSPWKVQDTANRAIVERRETGARVRCIGSDPKRAHGLAGSVICDEPAQWPSTTAARMYAALRTSLGKVEGSKMIAIGTRAADPEHWFSLLLRNPLAYGQVHATSDADREKRPYSLAAIRAANPSWAALPSLRRRVLREREEAKVDPALAAMWQALRLNGGTADVPLQEVVSAAAWRGMEREGGERSGPMVLGVDLGGGAAMSALAGYWPRTGHLEALAAFPAKPDLGAREKVDGVDGTYRAMERRGELLLCGEHAVDLPGFLSQALDRWGPPAVIVADRWKQKDLEQALATAAVPFCPALWRGQGFRDGSEDVRGFQRACAEGWVRPAPSLLLRAALSGARLVSDPARNQKLAKGSEGGRRQHHRDDAAAASILAVAEGYREAKVQGWSRPD